jgi:branched-chain amino acid transport system permease protein
MEQITQVLASGLSQGCIYGLLGLGFSVAGMSTRILNLAQGAYSLVGGFVFLLLVNGLKLPLAAAVPLVLVFAAVLGVATERVVNLRAKPWHAVSHDTAVLATLALLVAAEGAVFLVWGSEPQRGPSIQPGVFTLFGAVVAWQFLWMVGVTLAIALAMHLFLSRTWTGRAMRACAQNAMMSHLLGISVRRLGALAFGIGAAIGAVAGVLSSPITWLDYQLGGFFMLYGLLAYLIGGEDEVAGPLVGGLLLGLVQNIVLLLPGMTGGLLKQVVPMAALLLMLVFRPQGLLPRRSASA